VLDGKSTRRASTSRETNRRVAGAGVILVDDETRARVGEGVRHQRKRLEQVE
jgi:hypothetical protein